ncbi:nodulation competitiveness protein nfeD, partial [Burkholderia cenocepacia]
RHGLTLTVAPLYDVPAPAHPQGEPS